MARIVLENVYACEYCTLVIANGEFDGTTDDGLTDNDIAELHVSRFGPGIGGAAGVAITCLDNDDETPTGYDDTHYETIMYPSECDACGRMMHGEFHAFVILDND